MKHAALRLLPAIAVLATAAAPPASKVVRTTLQTQDFPGLIYKTELIKAVIPAGGEVPPHTHPGVEIGYIATGSASVMIAGAAPKTLGPGDSFAVPNQTVHSLKNTGSGPLTVLSSYVVDKRKPLITPAAAP